MPEGCELSANCDLYQGKLKRDSRIPEKAYKFVLDFFQLETLTYVGQIVFQIWAKPEFEK